MIIVHLNYKTYFSSIVFLFSLIVEKIPFSVSLKIFFCSLYCDVFVDENSGKLEMLVFQFY